ncbi:MAG TPA: STAS domain-containing protein [Anaerolineales bacterium]|nr:STAS domain-containing protein [Anaerolineales bacterium]
MFEITAEQTRGDPPVTIIRLKGSFDTAATDVFEPVTREALEQGAQNILLDLSGVTFLSSVGIRAITALYYELHPKTFGPDKDAVLAGIRSGDYSAPHLKLLKPSSDAERVLQMTGLSLVLESFEDESEAVESF